jgi:hypothetical protein
MAAVLAEPALAFARQQSQALADDPLGYLIRTSRRVGIGMIVAGVAMGAASWYLKAAATTAANNELNVVGNIGTIFSNIKAPTFQPKPAGTAPVLGPNPIQDIQNFFSDAWSDVQAAGGDIAQIGAAMGTLAEDVAVGIIDVAKAILAFVTHFPDILWNGLVWGLGGAIADVLNWLFPYFIVFGVILLGVSLLASGLRWVWRVTVADGLRAASAKFQVRVAARGERFWDVVFGNFKHPVAAAVAPAPLEPVAAPPAAAHVESAEGVGKIAPGPPALPGEVAVDGSHIESGENVGKVAPGPPALPGEVPAGPEDVGKAPPADFQAPEGVAVSPAPESQAASTVSPETNGSTAQTEQLLGGVPPPGWSQEDVNQYLAKTEPAPVPEPEAEPELHGREAAARADELLA